MCVCWSLCLGHVFNARAYCQGAVYIVFSASNRSCRHLRAWAVILSAMRAPAAAAAAGEDDDDHHNDDSLLPVVRPRVYDLRLTTQRQFQEPRDKRTWRRWTRCSSPGCHVSAAHQYRTQCYAGDNDEVHCYPAPPVRERGIAFGRFLCFFVSNITRKRLDRFAW